MVLVDWGEPEQLLSEREDPFPPDVEFVLSALEAGRRQDEDRAVLRTRYRVRAALKLFSDDAAASPKLLYLRDVSPQSAGFLCAAPVTLSHGGIVRLPLPSGSVAEIACTVLRCRLAAPGWYEGSVYFNREQHDLAIERISALLQ